MTSGECLDDNTLALWLDGTLPEVRREAARAHLDGCESCQRLVGAATRSRRTQAVTAEVDASPPPHELLARGTSVGRYIILEHVGSGGMSSVYAAFDPELDRKIALKFLHPHLQRLEALIRQEAQVMARLSHPGIVAVHDVGRMGDRVFVAMEFVAGETLEGLLRSKRLSWSEILAVFREAGRGLEAAHASRVVHGDFKPANVLIRSDGRVLVADFGLARIAEKDVNDSPGTPRGTPAFMAPEQLGGAPADVRSDLFSFCVTLYEALEGKPPFQGDTVEALRASMRAGPRPITARGLPRRVARVVTRGLAVEPSRRPASMRELLLELDPRPATRRWLFAAALAALAVGGAAWAARARTGAAQCRDVAARFSGIWDDARRGEIQRALTATHARFAPDVARRVTSEMDRFAAAWGEAYAAACEDSVRQRHDDGADYLRMACLSRELSEARAKMDLLAHADDGMVGSAISMVTALGEPATCGAVVHALPPLPPAQVRPGVEGVREKLTQVRALDEAARSRDARDRAQSLLKEAQALAWRPLQAEALLDLGETQRTLDEAQPALASATEAAFLAEASHDDLLAARAWIFAAFLTTERFAQFDRAQELERHAEVDLERAGGDDWLLARLRDASGMRLARMGRFEASLEVERESCALFERTGRNDRFYSWALNDEAVALYLLDRVDPAVELWKRSLQLKERLLGEHHPDVAIALSNLADVYTRHGRFEESHAVLDRAEKILTDAADLDAFIAVAVHTNAGDLAYAQRDLSRALGYYERAVAEAKLDQRNVHQTARNALIGLGRTLTALGRPAEAIPHLEKALPEEAAEVDPIDLGDVTFALAQAITAVHGDPRRAHALAERAEKAYAGAGARGTAPGAEVSSWLASRPSP